MVIGGGSSACEDALISPASPSRSRCAFGGTELDSLVIRDRGSEALEGFRPAAAFVFIGREPESGLVSDVASVDELGFVRTGQDLLHGDAPHWPSAERPPFGFDTGVPGVFTAGDVRHGSTRQVAFAVGEGAAAAIAIEAYLKLP